MSRDAFETSAAPYVLGALSPADRATFLEHLERCPACRARVDELAGLPGLLARVSPEQVAGLADPAPAPPLPASLLPDLLTAVGQRRRRRRWATAAVGLAAACAVLLAVLVGVQRPDAPTPLAMRPLTSAPISASVGLASVPWGTRVGLTCTYAASDGVSRRYALVVVGEDGRRESIGTWTAVPGRQVRLTGASSITRADIAAVEVQAPGGYTLLRVTPPQ